MSHVPVRQDRVPSARRWYVYPLCWSIWGLTAGLILGCSSFRGFPPRTVDPSQELALLQIYFSPEKLAEYNDPHRSDPQKAQLRNEIINGRLAAIDIHFNLYQQDLHKEGIGLNIGTDAITLGLGAAGAVASGGASQILSAASAGVVGVKQSIDKNAFFEKTMAALLTQMMALRKSVLVRIRDGLSKPISEYPVTQGFADLEDYYYAGTIPGAITGVIESAGATSAEADKLLKEIRFSLDDAARKLRQAICPDPNCTNPNMNRIVEMRRCWPQANIPENTFALDFIFQPAFASQRRTVVACMGL